MSKDRSGGINDYIRVVLESGLRQADKSTEEQASAQLFGAVNDMTKTTVNCDEVKESSKAGTLRT